MANALAEDRLAGYAADVFEFEDWQRPDRPRSISQRLLSSEKTLFTPHLGSAVASARREIALEAARNIVEAFAVNSFRCDSLSALTLRSDLRNLSLLTYKDIFTDKNLIRKQKAWCPRCLDEMRKGGTKRIYEPLLWKIHAVRICPIHHQFLETRCPKCCREPDHVSRHSRNGYCSRKSCEKWLGNSADLSREEHEIQAELFYATEVGNLLAIMKRFSGGSPSTFHCRIHFQAYQ